MDSMGLDQQPALLLSKALSHAQLMAADLLLPSIGVVQAIQAPKLFPPVFEAPQLSIFQGHLYICQYFIMSSTNHPTSKSKYTISKGWYKFPLDYTTSG